MLQVWSARENACFRDIIGFRFTSELLRKWHGFFKPITEQSKLKPKQMRITFGTELKTAL